MVIFYHRFTVIDSCIEAESRGLKFHNNVYGDVINHFNCRSLYNDEYGFMYRCSELKKT